MLISSLVCMHKTCVVWASYISWTADIWETIFIPVLGSKTNDFSIDTQAFKPCADTSVYPTNVWDIFHQFPEHCNGGGSFSILYKNVLKNISAMEGLTGAGPFCIQNGPYDRVQITRFPSRMIPSRTETLSLHRLLHLFSTFYVPLIV